MVIEGEIGMGKEVVVCTVHIIFICSGGFFVVFDCGAVSENLIEFELFGYEKGFFIGVIMVRQGFFEMVQGGTIFFDEFGELNLDL